MLGNILLTLVLVGILFASLRFRKKREKSAEQEHVEDHAKAKTAEDDHGHKPAAKSGGHDPHDHPKEKKDGWGLLKFSLGFLALVAVAWIGSWAIGYMGGFSIPQTRGQALREMVSSAPSASSYSSPVIPPGACTVVPEDAREVVAPVDGCSEPIVVDRGTFLCTDPDPSSGQVRAKNWYGESEPTDWDSGSAKGDHACMGTVSGVDSTTPTEPRTVHVWFEKFQ